ncbi:MAG TPA: fatty acyl-AMP ligase [Allosphingosinicella sp.]|nr:fatty acyl-AMP ligase [Allosphingosinicella sp.]
MNTMTAVLTHHAEVIGDQAAYIYSPARTNCDQAITYADLHRDALQIACVLRREHGLGEKRALLLYQSGLDFIRALYGCLYAGIVCVPMYLPRLVEDERLAAVLGSADVAAILTVSSRRAFADALVATVVGSRPQVICTDEIVRWSPRRSPETLLADPSALAIIQFTSGSLGRPKGVMISNANIIANQRMIKHGFGHVGGEVVVGWLPFFHDMGLIGNIFQPMFVGGLSVMMAPTHFLQNPARWLELISSYRAVTSGAPNFAYDYCVEHVSGTHLDRLDLSCWKVAYNGAELVRESTMRRFAEKFAPLGFEYGSFLPCYGLAEATLYVTGRRLGDDPSAAELAEQGDGTAPVSVGRPAPEAVLRILGPDAMPVGAGQVGEICVGGPHVTEGYFRHEELTAASFVVAADTKERLFRTGDLGRQSGDDLFITGREKNLLVVNGKNYQGEEIEFDIARQSELFCPSGTCILQVDEGLVTNRFVVLQEVSKRIAARLSSDSKDVDHAAYAAARHVLARFGLPVTEFLFLRENKLPRTSSGKINRLSTASLLASKTVGIVHRASVR